MTLMGFKWTSIMVTLPGLNQSVLIADREGRWTTGSLIFHGGHIAWMQDEPVISAEQIAWWTYVPEVPQTKQVQP